MNDIIEKETDGIVNKSEIKFLTWSKLTDSSSYDVKAVAENLRATSKEEMKGLDVGGGMGKFSAEICRSINSAQIDVIDKSRLAASHFIAHDRVNLIQGDFFEFESEISYDFVILRTVLHHFIGRNESETQELQLRALGKAKSLLADRGKIFIVENFYESYVNFDLTARLIYFLTSLKQIQNVIRSLGANTAGEGVRFRSFSSWGKLLEKSDLRVSRVIVSDDWGIRMPFWQKIPLLCTKRYQAVLVVERC